MQPNPLFTTLQQYGGIATRAQLIGHGIPAREIGDAVRAGSIHRVRRAHYATAQADPRGLVAVRVGGRLTAGSATRTYGLWGGSTVPVHVRLPSNAARLRPPHAQGRVRLHWVDGRLARECWRDDPEESLLGAARWEPDETAIAILDTAVGRGVTTIPHLTRLFADESPRLRRLVQGVRLGSESGIESLARQRLEKAGHEVEQQVLVPGVGRVDMRVDGGLLVEFDGYETHGSREAFERDRVRDSSTRLQGLPIVRFSARQVLQQWPTVARTIARIAAEPAGMGAP
ncbi:hypothetical protein [Leifsonia sp. SIMBA_070]|uniref:hypothetical protein n=1 Tax=Leifsonia sp. SIMBA_070 TaxID=3085810 RepID=UPI00397CAB32